MTVLHPVQVTSYAFVLLLYNNQKHTRTAKVFQAEKHYLRTQGLWKQFRRQQSAINNSNESIATSFSYF